MPLRIPNLDDRTYDDLVAEAIAMIPRYAPLWTNHNPSDPGITIIELLAYFTEMLIYRLDRVGIHNKINFLKLLSGYNADEKGLDLETLSVEEVDKLINEVVLALHEPNRAITSQDFEYLVKAALALEEANKYELSVEEVDKLINKAVLALHEPNRAITSQDFEYLAKAALALEEAKKYEIEAVKALCVVGKNLELDVNSRNLERPGHVSIVIVAGRKDVLTSGNDSITEIADHHYSEVLDEVKNFIEPKCLLTTRLHVVSPNHIWIALKLRIKPKPLFQQEGLLKICNDRISQFFNPFIKGNKDSDGRSLGRNIFISELIEILEQIPEVDYLENPMVLAIAPTAEQLSEEDANVGIYIGENSHLGVDTILGIKGRNNGDRLILDGLGGLSGIKVNPYELPHVVLQESSPLSTVNPLARMKGDYV